MEQLNTNKARKHNKYKNNSGLITKTKISKYKIWSVFNQKASA